MTQARTPQAARRSARSRLRDASRDPYVALGMAYQAYGGPPGIRYKGKYHSVGVSIWRKVRWQVYHTLCKDGAPRFWAKESVGGDIRELAVNIAVLLSAKLDVSLGIAVPLAALVAKRGLHSFCRRPSETTERVTIQVILKEKDAKEPLSAPKPARRKRTAKRRAKR